MDGAPPDNNLISRLIVSDEDKARCRQSVQSHAGFTLSLDSLERDEHYAYYTNK